MWHHCRNDPEILTKGNLTGTNRRLTMESHAASAHVQGSESPSHEFSQACRMHKKALFYFECDSLEGLHSEGSHQYSEETHSLTLRSVYSIPGLLCLLLHLSRSWPQAMAPEQGAGFELQ